MANKDDGPIRTVAKLELSSFSEITVEGGIYVTYVAISS